MDSELDAFRFAAVPLLMLTCSADTKAKPCHEWFVLNWLQDGGIRLSVRLTQGDRDVRDVITCRDVWRETKFNMAGNRKQFEVREGEEGCRQEQITVR